MQRKLLLGIMESGQIKPSADMDALRILAKDFPYCAAYQVMGAMADKAADSVDQKKSLQRAAVAIQDRSKLYTYMLSAQVETQIAHFEEAVSEPFVQSHEIRVETRQVENPKEQKASLISSKPMEEEIMREAIIHIGELETSDYLAQLEKQGEPITDEPFNISRPAASLSFGDWLMKLSDKQMSSKPNQDLALIDKFISEAPQISPVKATFFSPSQMGKLSLVDDESFVTETLAKIYLRQGHSKKAIRAFELLALKYPEKTRYFAALKKEAEDQALNN